MTIRYDVAGRRIPQAMPTPGPLVWDAPCPRCGVACEWQQKAGENGSLKVLCECRPGVAA